jgi:hypothetical protein
VLHAFTWGSDGADPYASVSLGTGGVIYGTTGYGGAIMAPECLALGPGCGKVFALVPPAPGQTGWTEKALWEFHGPSRDGDGPYSTLLIVDAPAVEKGVYGTTVASRAATARSFGSPGAS